MIAMIDVSPRDPNRIFVAALGHPYGPNPERGIFRSSDGGRTFEKVLYKDEYTSGSDVRIDSSNPDVVYAALWQQQQSFIEGGQFAGNSGGIFKSIDGGTTWKQLTDGLPTVQQANLGIAASDPKMHLRHGRDGCRGRWARRPGGRTRRRRRRGPGRPGLQRQRRHRTATSPLTAVTTGSSPRCGPNGGGERAPDPRPLARIGGGDLPTLAVDGKDPNVVYSCSTVFWRTEDGGATWTAVRGAPGGDDYQKAWVNPTNSDILLVVSDQGGGHFRQSR